MASQECNGGCKNGGHCGEDGCSGKECACQGCNGDCRCHKEVPAKEPEQ